MSIEYEKKWKILNFDRKMIPEGSVEQVIFQTYLTTAEECIERRVREIRKNSTFRFVFNEKEKIKGSQGRRECEVEIDSNAYRYYLLSTKAGTYTILKFRYTFCFCGWTFELDVYDGYLKGLVTLEAEADSEDRLRAILPPQGFQFEDVTGNRIYSNAHLATLTSPPT